MIGIFLDIESNGLSVMKHRVIEIAFKFIALDSKEEIANYSTIVSQPEEVWAKSDPNSLKVNGFSFADLEGGKPENIVSKEIFGLFQKHQIKRNQAVYICQNPSFDRSFFSQLIDPEIQEEHLWPYHWLDLASMFWSLCLDKWHRKESLPPWEIGISKNKIAQFLGLQEEEVPHKALQGVNHLILCYHKLFSEA